MIIKRGLIASRYILFIFVILMGVLLLYYKPSITGGVVYDEILAEKNWGFNNLNDFIYDGDLLNLSGNEVKLASIITLSNSSISELVPISVTSAVLPNHNYESVTDKVQTLDGESANLNKDNSLLNIIFDTPLINGDVIALYLLYKNNVQTSLYVCDYNTTCVSPGYGLVDFNEIEGWYNITLSALSAPKTNLAIDPPSQVKIDYVQANHFQTTYSSLIDISYPLQAEISTLDFQPENWQSWGIFSAQAELNNQQINYFYSLDSGISWTKVPVSYNFSSIPNNKLRIKAVLHSDGTATPLLDNLNLQYTTNTPASCQEDWDDHYSNCSIDNTNIKYYLDLNECGTIINLPADNSTVISCDYCTPNWQQINSSCTPGNYFESTYGDTNNCYALTTLAEDNNSPASELKECNYCLLNNCTNSTQKNPVLSGENTFSIDGKNETKVYLEIRSKNITSPVNIIAYSQNIKDGAPESMSAYKFFEINTNNTINANNGTVNSVKIVIYYTDEEIAAKNLKEDNLQIYYFNESTKGWEALVSVVNTTANYVYAVVSHLSYYGLFSQESEVSENNFPGSDINVPVSSGGGSGSGGSSSGSKLGASEIKRENIGIVLKALGEEKNVEEIALDAQQGCNYVLEVNLPTTISFIKKKSFQGEIINKGNCVIQSIDLYADAGLSSIVEFSPAVITGLAVGNSSTFTLIRKTESMESGWLSYLTGSAVIRDIVTKKISGTISIEGKEGDNSLFNKNLDLDLEILSFEKIKKGAEFAVFPVIAVIFIISILLMMMVRYKNKKLSEKR